VKAKCLLRRQVARQWISWQWQ